MPLIDGKHVLVLGADPVGASVLLATALSHSAEARRLGDERERQEAQAEHTRRLTSQLRDL